MKRTIATIKPRQSVTKGTAKALTRHCKDTGLIFGEPLSIEKHPEFILIKARISCGDLVKIKFIGYTEEQAIQSFKGAISDIENFR